MQAYLLDKNSWTGKNAADNDFDFCGSMSIVGVALKQNN